MLITLLAFINKVINKVSKSKEIMKTYYETVEVEKPLLDIRYDSYAQSPRNGENLGYLITCETKYNSPDKHTTLEAIVKQTGEEANNLEEHINAIRQRVADEMDEVITDIFPVHRYEHGNIIYRRGVAHGFDYSNCGFYIITNKTYEKYGKHAKPIEALIDGELELYTSYVNGEVYQWTLFDEEGNEVDSGGGYYSLDEIKEQLPKSWKKEDLSKYITHY